MADELTPEQVKFNKSVEATEASLRKEILDNKEPSRTREQKQVVPPARLVPESQQFSEAPVMVVTPEIEEARSKSKSSKGSGSGSSSSSEKAAST